MNYSTAIFLISDKVRAVGVTYEQDVPGKPAAVTVFKTFDRGIGVGDYVVVPTDTRHNMTVCKVKSVDVEVDFDASVEMKWIVGKIDRADVESIQAQEADAIIRIKAAEKNRKKEELRATLMAAAGSELKALPLYSVPETTETKG